MESISLIDLSMSAIAMFRQLGVEQPSEDFDGFFDRATSQAVVMLVRLDKKRAHPIRRLYLYLKLACRLAEIPQSIVICSGMGHTKLLNVHSGTDVPDQLNNPVHVAHARGHSSRSFRSFGRMMSEIGMFRQLTRALPRFSALGSLSAIM